MRLIGMLIIAVGLAGIISCSSIRPAITDPKEFGVGLQEAESDSVEYDLLITDPGFETWFVTNRRPVWYHNKRILEQKNWQYVLAWNEKVRDGLFQLMNPRNPFEQQIQYDFSIDYGMDLNYKLYYYFKFIENKWGKFSR